MFMEPRQALGCKMLTTADATQSTAQAVNGLVYPVASASHSGDAARNPLKRGVRIQDIGCKNSLQGSWLLPEATSLEESTLSVQ